MSVLAVSFTAAIALLFTWGFTGPSGVPPTGSGLIYATGGNVGIGTSTPGYKLTVAGNISAAFNQIVNVASPTATSSVATKGYVDATSGASFAGYTATTYTGNLGGLTGANAKCKAEFAGSHFCSVYEFSETGNTTNPSANARINAIDSYDYSLLYSGFQYACYGWANGTIDIYGPYINTVGTYLDETCDILQKLTCCY